MCGAVENVLLSSTLFSASSTSSGGRSSLVSGIVKRREARTLGTGHINELYGGLPAPITRQDPQNRITSPVVGAVVNPPDLGSPHSGLTYFPEKCGPVGRSLPTAPYRFPLCGSGGDRYSIVRTGSSPSGCDGAGSEAIRLTTLRLM